MAPTTTILLIYPVRASSGIAVLILAFAGLQYAGHNSNGEHLAQPIGIQLYGILLLSAFFTQLLVYQNQQVI